MAKLRILGVAVVCALCLTMSGILVGCDNSQSPKSVADTYLKELKSTSATETMDLLGADDAESVDDLFGQDFATTIAEKIVDFDYKLGSEKIDGDRASVEVTITTYNLGQAYTNFFTSYMQQVLVMAFSGSSEEDIAALAENLLEEELSKAPKDYVSTVPLYLNKVDGEWVVDDSAEGNLEVFNALTGGLFDAFEQIIQQYTGLFSY